MQFSIPALLAMAVSVVAQTADFNPVYTPEEGTVIPAGSTFEITWDAPEQYRDETISITLIGGPNQGGQVPLQDIASGIPNSQESYQWTVDRSLGAEAVYGLILSLDSNPDIYQFSMPFQIEGTTSSVTVDSSGLPTTVTESYGTKTVTLSSAVVSSTPVSVTTTTTSTPVVNSTTSTPSSTSLTTVVSNSTSTTLAVSTSRAVVTSTHVVDGTTPTGDGSAPTPTDDNGSGAGALTAPVALIGALAVAFLAL